MKLQPAASLKTGQQLRLTQEMAQAIAILGMTAAELTEHLGRVAADNPVLLVSAPPARAAPFDAVGVQGVYPHVLARIPALFAGSRDRRIAVALLEELDEAGLMRAPLTLVAQATGASEAEVEAVLLALQEMEPTGIFARSLAECFALQLTEQDRMTPDLRRVLAVLPALARGGAAAVAAESGLPRARADKALGALAGLDPRPAARLEVAQPVAVVPDLVLHRDAGGWQVGPAPSLPRLALDRRLAAASGFSAAARQARALLRAVETRQAALVAIATRAVAHQTGFLDHGAEALQPLTMREIASALGLHESTVGRIVNATTLATPGGAVPLRRLFPAARAGQAGGAITARLARRIAAEDRARPYSDGDLSDWLAGQGIGVTRRMVAKYRAKARIPDCRSRRLLAGA